MTIAEQYKEQLDALELVAEEIALWDGEIEPAAVDSYDVNIPVEAYHADDHCGLKHTLTFLLFKDHSILRAFSQPHTEDENLFYLSYKAFPTGKWEALKVFEQVVEHADLEDTLAVIFENEGRKMTLNDLKKHFNDIKKANGEGGGVE